MYILCEMSMPKQSMIWEQPMMLLTAAVGSDGRSAAVCDTLCHKAAWRAWLASQPECSDQSETCPATCRMNGAEQLRTGFSSGVSSSSSCSSNRLIDISTAASASSVVNIDVLPCARETNGRADAKQHASCGWRSEEQVLQRRTVPQTQPWVGGQTALHVAYIDV